MGAKLRFLFEGYVLDEARRELWRGSETVAVEARVFDLLIYLVRNRDRVVSQEDLRMAVWDGRIVSISTISSTMNAVRSAIGDTGNDQRLIRTVPRKGFRFIAPVIEEPSNAEQSHSAISAEAQVPDTGGPLTSPEPAGQPPTEMSFRQRDDSAVRHARSMRTAGAFAIGAAIGALAAILFFLLWPLQDAPQARPSKRFDAATVPLVDDDTRRALASYASRPDYKALAIGGVGQFHVSDGADSAEKAKEAALQGCYHKIKRPCRVYAVDTDVVWSEQALPLPAARDIRTESLGIALDPNIIPLIPASERRAIAERLRTREISQALAISTRRSYTQASPTRGEAARVAVERCSFRYGRPCLILAVDGFLTIQIPKTRRVTRILLPSTDPEIPDAEKERIARLYQGRDWRALARGDSGSWHAIADAPSEADAIKAVLQACEQADSGCQLYAIGNFVVADEG
jgi:DNA-binding winged helix-turn-helix (wHTH) protein